MSIDETRNNKIIMSMVVAVLLVISAYFLYFNYKPNIVSNNLSLTAQEKDIKRQQMINQSVLNLSKRTDAQGMFLYDMEMVEHDNTTSPEHKAKLLNKYKNLLSSSTEKHVSSTTVDQNYKRDMAVYGWVYVYGKSVQAVPNTITDLKKIKQWHKDDIEKALKIAYIPISPEIINDKVFLATRLKLTSGYLIDFKDMMKRKEIEQYQKLIKLDIEAINRTNMSIFSYSNSKFTMAPLTYKMLALVALNDTYTPDVDTTSLIEKQYKEYKDLKTDDLYSYAWAGIYVDTYYLYYLDHPGFGVASTSPSHLKKIADAKSDMSERLKYSDLLRSGFKRRADYLRSDNGKWEIAKMAMTEI